MIIKLWVPVILAAVLGFFCLNLFSVGKSSGMDIAGKWKLEIYEKDNAKKVNTVFIKEFRKDMTYTYSSTLFKRWGGVE